MEYLLKSHIKEQRWIKLPSQSCSCLFIVCYCEIKYMRIILDFFHSYLLVNIYNYFTFNFFNHSAVSKQSFWRMQVQPKPKTTPVLHDYSNCSLQSTLCFCSFISNKSTPVLLANDSANHFHPAYGVQMVLPGLCMKNCWFQRNVMLN